MDKHDHARTSWRRLGSESDMEEEFILVCQRSDGDGDDDSDDDGDGDDGACICCSIQDHISTTCVQSVMHFIITLFKLHAKMPLLG